jgi:hypothetical protein
MKAVTKFGSKWTSAASWVAVVAFLTLGFQGLAIAQVPPCAVGCGGFHVPELDPHTIGAGLTVFGGAAALLIERYRHRKR